MNKKYYAVYPGQIQIDDEVFFGIDYKITDFINELMEQVQKQKDVIDKAIELLNNPWSFESGNKEVDEITYNKKRKVIDILKEVE